MSWRKDLASHQFSRRAQESRAHDAEIGAVASGLHLDGEETGRVLDIETADRA
jgi:hypothetical protein